MIPFAANAEGAVACSVGDEYRAILTLNGIRYEKIEPDCPAPAADPPEFTSTTVIDSPVFHTEPKP